MTTKSRLAIAVLMALLAITVAMAQPTGADLTSGVSERGTNSTPGNATAQAGNVTQLNIDQNVLTKIWQGFYGNVTGQIVLENAAGNNFYDWSVTNISGEILATRTFVNDWSNIECTNETHWESEETTLNIGTSDIEGLNETFSSVAHPSFGLAGQTLSGCPSTQAYNNAGAGLFWNVLLNANITHTVYTALHNDDGSAFAGSTADFELLVPVDTTQATQVYYFYMELS